MLNNPLPTQVLALSLTAYSKATSQGITKSPYIAIIDYSLPSNKKRLWIYDINTKQIVLNTWVAHGKNSGGLYSTEFSNKIGSLQTSIGVFVTNGLYQGKHGTSLRLNGLEKTNNNAEARSIVIHSASYVNKDLAEQKAIGRSWGCPAIPEDAIKDVLYYLKDNALIISYYPDKNWLTTSRFLN